VPTPSWADDRAPGILASRGPLLPFTVERKGWNVMGADEKLSALSGWLRGMMQSGLTPCVSLAVMQGNRLVYSLTEGQSRPGGDGAISIDGATRFNIGSMTKPVTASLVVRLAEMGLLTLDDPVKRHIPEYPFEKVTLLHLMTHTSGCSEEQDWSIPAWPRTAADLDRSLRQVYSLREFKYPTDTECRYFSVGYAVLMDVIQRLTSRSIEELARETLFEPLGMHHTTYETDRLEDASLAMPWKRIDPDRFAFMRHAPPTGDNSLYSTAGDMVRFANLFLTEGVHEGRQVLSKASIDLMRREVTGGRFSRTPAFWRKGDGPFRSAFGDLNSPDALCHPGFSGTQLCIDPAYRLSFVFITDSNDVHDDYTNFRKVANAVLAAFT
jgi:serine-type D-Ala-D-Ala carboxypeptidase